MVFQASERHEELTIHRLEEQVRRNDQVRVSSDIRNGFRASKSFANEVMSLLLDLVDLGEHPKMDRWLQETM